MMGLREKLEAEGWRERFTASGVRLEEMADYYRSLGYEVRMEDVEDVAGLLECTSCFTEPLAEGPVRVIFTRPGSEPVAEDDELYE